MDIIFDRFTCLWDTGNGTGFNLVYLLASQNALVTDRNSLGLVLASHNLTVKKIILE
jgi:hypothetical protein